MKRWDHLKNPHKKTLIYIVLPRLPYIECTAPIFAMVQHHKAILQLENREVCQFALCNECSYQPAQHSAGWQLDFAVGLHLLSQHATHRLYPHIQILTVVCIHAALGARCCFLCQHLSGSSQTISFVTTQAGSQCKPICKQTPC